jgi:hypothetical protein
VTADLIKQIADHLPDNTGGAFYSPPSISLGGGKRVAFPVDKALGSFAHLYKNVSFGWHSAAMFASVGKAYPVALRGDDHWIFKAYLYCRNPKLYADKHIHEALMLAHPDMKSVRDVIEALLLTKEYGSIEQTAEASGVHRNTVAAYEKLFFNILDRRKDLMYIRNVVYPDSRLVEMFDGYAAAEDFGVLLKRYGFNHSGDELLYLTGLPRPQMDELSSAVAAGKLEGALMTQGYMLTKLGFANQTQNAQAIYHARSVIAAAKQGGQDTSGSEMPMSSVSDLLYETFRDTSRAQATEELKLKRTVKYASHTIEV